MNRRQAKKKIKNKWMTPKSVWVYGAAPPRVVDKVLGEIAQEIFSALDRIIREENEANDELS